MEEDCREACRRKVLEAVRALPEGHVASYGEIARRAGLPGRARWVARVLAEAGEPGLPWHRVVRGDGRIAFPAGSADAIEQVGRLLGEGVEVREGRVRGAIVKASLDELLWSGPAPEDASSRRRRGRRD